MVVRKWSWWRGISCRREPPAGASWYQTRLKKTARSAFKAFGCVAAGPRGSFLSREWLLPYPLSGKQGQRIPALCGARGGGGGGGGEPFTLGLCLEMALGRGALS